MRTPKEERFDAAYAEDQLNPGDVFRVIEAATRVELTDEVVDRYDGGRFDPTGSARRRVMREVLEACGFEVVEPDVRGETVGLPLTGGTSGTSPELGKRQVSKVDGKPGCPEWFWDGPYQMRCSRGVDVCVRHGAFATIEREGGGTSGTSPELGEQSDGGASAGSPRSWSLQERIQWHNTLCEKELADLIITQRKRADEWFRR